MEKRPRYKLEEISQVSGIDQRLIVEFIHHEWIIPAEPDSNELDDEDLARVRLIQELKVDFGVNNEAVPIILHLLDQIHRIRQEAKKWAKATRYPTSL